MVFKTGGGGDGMMEARRGRGSEPQQAGVGAAQSGME